MKERLQKIIAQSGLCSRRTAETLIANGKVTINGRKASIGQSADPVKDHICVEGKPISRKEQKKYIMLYKPRGFVTTMKDERGRKNVSQLVKKCSCRVYPVGRLDVDSEGLLIMTNDGELTQRLTHPSHEVTKTYSVTVRGNLENIPLLAEPMEIDGYTIKPATVYILNQKENQARLEIRIHEGRNRQIRKMCEKCGFTVHRLKRVSVGKLELDSSLTVGKWRELSQSEISYLRSL